MGGSSGATHSLAFRNPQQFLNDEVNSQWVTLVISCCNSLVKTLCMIPHRLHKNSVFIFCCMKTFPRHAINTTQMHTEHAVHTGGLQLRNHSQITGPERIKLLLLNWIRQPLATKGLLVGCWLVAGCCVTEPTAHLASVQILPGCSQRAVFLFFFLPPFSYYLITFKVIMTTWPDDWTLIGCS